MSHESRPAGAADSERTWRRVKALYPRKFPKVDRRALLLVALLVCATYMVHALASLPEPGVAPTGVDDSRIPGGVDFVLTPNRPQPTSAPASAGPVAMRIEADRASVLAGSDGRVRLEVSLDVEELEASTAMPTDLVVILDHSGSMGGWKIEQARSAVLDLIDRLGDQDRFALVPFASGADLAVPLTHATPVARARWRQRVALVRAGGGTNMTAGLGVALGALAPTSSDRVSRILLLSDGHAGSEGLMLEQAAKLAFRGTVLSSLGIGDGFNEVLMGHLADAGHGNFYYLSSDVARSSDELAEVFANELTAGRLTAARQARLLIEPTEGTRVVAVAGYSVREEADGRVSVALGDLFSGQERRLWVTLETDTGFVYHERSMARARLDFDDLTGARQVIHVADVARVACVDDRKQFLADVDGERWARSVVEEEYGGLQEQVARLVKEQKREEAKTAIEDFRRRNLSLNEALDMSAVAENMVEVKKLEERVDDAFTGADQARSQSLLSKDTYSMSKQLRQSGAKYMREEDR